LADLWSTPCAFFWRTDLRVPAGARPSLRPCYREGDAIRQSSGEMRREDAKVCLLFASRNEIDQKSVRPCPGRSAASLRRCAAEPGPLFL